VFSAKGALLLLAWDIALGHLINRNRSAEGAFHQRWRLAEVESRFQRWRFCFHQSWSGAPGSRLNAAPLARNIRIFIAP